MKDIKKNLEESLYNDLLKNKSKILKKYNIKEDESLPTFEYKLGNFDYINIELIMNNLLIHYSENHNEYSSQILLLIFSYLAIEDENKRLTLTKEQYDTWLKTNKQFLTTRQFEIIYGLSPRQQKEQRQKINDPLPSFKLGDNKNILYDRNICDKWFENYRKD